MRAFSQARANLACCHKLTGKLNHVGANRLGGFHNLNGLAPTWRILPVRRQPRRLPPLLDGTVRDAWPMDGLKSRRGR